jgi:hypothetical protein
MLNVLLADREAAKLQLAELAQLHAALKRQHEALAKEHAILHSRGRCEHAGPAQRIDLPEHHWRPADIAVGQVPRGHAYSSFRNMDAVVSALVAHHEGRPGISERTLWSKLAQARRHLEASR